MIAFVDPDLCIGCTQCAGLCPAVFRMDKTKKKHYTTNRKGAVRMVSSFRLGQ